ncbi:HSP20-like chaperone [Phycomyces nitens]|nr:HSP20-like chaperone [Phycomyces nitens]
MPKCTRKGCGKEFKEEDNKENCCQFHSGTPVFHEGLKGWSCCSKRVTDFDDFMNMPGCTFGSHSTEAPVVAEAAPKESSPAATQVTKDGVEVYGAPKAETKKETPAAALSVSEKVEEVKKVEVEEDDDESIPVPEGKTCKRRGCGVSYKGDSVSRGNGAEAVCCYHPGAPVFHEGSKGWSCCPRKVLEFDEFLKLKGCKQGKHLFVGSNKSEEELVDCRTDWYQTPTHVMLSIFAKNKLDTKVTFNKDSVDIDVKMKDNKRYKKHLDLFHTIDIDQSKFSVLSTKLELNMKKTGGVSWAALEPTSDVTSWTTFGVSGGGGTVGAKEMQYTDDSPLNLSNRK